MKLRLLAVAMTAGMLAALAGEAAAMAEPPPGMKNFRAPGSAPDYFSNESGPFHGVTVARPSQPAVVAPAYAAPAAPAAVARPVPRYAPPRYVYNTTRRGHTRVARREIATHGRGGHVRVARREIATHGRGGHVRVARRGEAARVHAVHERRRAPEVHRAATRRAATTGHYAVAAKTRRMARAER